MQRTWAVALGLVLSAGAVVSVHGFPWPILLSTVSISLSLSLYFL